MGLRRQLCQPHPWLCHDPGAREAACPRGLRPGRHRLDDGRGTEDLPRHGTGPGAGVQARRHGPRQRHRPGDDPQSQSLPRGHRLCFRAPGGEILRTTAGHRHPDRDVGEPAADGTACGPRRAPAPRRGLQDAGDSRRDLGVHRLGHRHHDGLCRLRRVGPGGAHADGTHSQRHAGVVLHRIPAAPALRQGHRERAVRLRQVRGRRHAAHRGVVQHREDVHRQARGRDGARPVHLRRHHRRDSGERVRAPVVSRGLPGALRDQQRPREIARHLPRRRALQRADRRAARHRHRLLRRGRDPRDLRRQVGSGRAHHWRAGGRRHAARTELVVPRVAARHRPGTGRAEIHLLATGAGGIAGHSRPALPGTHGRVRAGGRDESDSPGRRNAPHRAGPGLPHAPGRHARGTRHRHGDAYPSARSGRCTRPQACAARWLR